MYRALYLRSWHYANNRNCIPVLTFFVVLYVLLTFGAGAYSRRICKLRAVYDVLK